MAPDAKRKDEFSTLLLGARTGTQDPHLCISISNKYFHTEAFVTRDTKAFRVNGTGGLGFVVVERYSVKD